MMRPPNAIVAAARDRGSGSSAGRGSGRKAPLSSTWISRPASISIASPKLLSAVLSLPCGCRARSRGRTPRAASRRCRACRDRRAPRAPSMPSSCSSNQVGGGRHHLVQARLARSARSRRARDRAPGTSMPGRLRELLHRIHERQPALVGHPADRVAMRAAAEAVIEALVVVDREARRLFVMERAARLPLAPGALELHRLADQPGEQGPGAELVEKGGGEGQSSPSLPREEVGGLG